jgi:hypothetical protein
MPHMGVMSSHEPLEWQCLLFHISPHHIQTGAAIVLVIGCLALSAPIFLVMWGVSNIKLFMIAYWYKLSWLAHACRRLQAKCHKVIHLDLEHVIKAFFWTHSMEYDQYRPAIPFDTLLVPIAVLCQSLWLHLSPLTNDGLRVKYEHATAKWLWALHYRPFLNSRHGLWSM